jgi:hypothetical protein
MTNADEELCVGISEQTHGASTSDDAMRGGANGKAKIRDSPAHC